MTYEDFTTYVEVDPNSHITITPNHIDHNVWENEDAWVHKDFGVDYFGNFVHAVNIRYILSDIGCHSWAYMITSALEDRKGLVDAGEDYIAVFVYGSDPPVIKLERCDTGAAAVDSYVSVDNTWYYHVIERNGTALTCKIYSDAARTVLLDTLSLTLAGDFPSLRYVMVANERNRAVAVEANVDIDNLDLDWAAVVPPKGNVTIQAMQAAGII